MDASQLPQGTNPVPNMFWPQTSTSNGGVATVPMPQTIGNPLQGINEESLRQAGLGNKDHLQAAGMAAAAIAAATNGGMDFRQLQQFPGMEGFNMNGMTNSDCIAMADGMWKAATQAAQVEAAAMMMGGAMPHHLAAYAAAIGMQNRFNGSSQPVSFHRFF